MRARWSSTSVGRYSAFHCLFVTSNTAWSRLDAVSSGPKIRKLSGFRRITSVRYLPSSRVASEIDPPGTGTSTAKSRKSGSRRSLSSSPPLACGLSLIRSVPPGDRAVMSALTEPSASNSSSGWYDVSHSSSTCRCASVSRALASGTWCDRQESSTCLPSMTGGQVQPFGVLKMIIGQAGRDSSPAAARALISEISSSTTSSSSANRACTAAWSSPSNPPTNRCGLWPYPRMRSSSSSSGMRARTVGLAILYPLRCRIGSTTPSLAGSMNLFECQEVARGPVSASPSPTTAATSRSGLSNAAPYACDRA